MFLPISEEKSIAKSSDGSALKEKELCFVWNTTRACLFCFVILVWGKSCQEMEGKQGPRLLLLESVRSSELMYMCRMCQTFVFISCISGAPEHGRNRGGWHSAAPFVRCHFTFLSAWLRRAAAQRNRRTEGRPSLAADRAIVISYSLEPCWSPSAACTLKHTRRRSWLKYEHVKENVTASAVISADREVFAHCVKVTSLQMFHFCEFFIWGGIRLWPLPAVLFCFYIKVTRGTFESDSYSCPVRLLALMDWRERKHGRLKSLQSWGQLVPGQTTLSSGLWSVTLDKQGDLSAWQTHWQTDGLELDSTGNREKPAEARTKK